MKTSLLVVSLLVLAVSTYAHPLKWKVCPLGAGNNYGHPTNPHGNHKGIAADGKIRIVLSVRGKPTATYCPGATYNLNVAFPTARKYMLTTSAGKLSGPTVLCNGLRVNQNLKAKAHSGQVFVPKSYTGPLVIKITTAESGTGAYKHNTLTLKKGRC